MKVQLFVEELEDRSCPSAVADVTACTAAALVAGQHTPPDMEVVFQQDVVNTTPGGVQAATPLMPVASAVTGDLNLLFSQPLAWQHTTDGVLFADVPKTEWLTAQAALCAGQSASVQAADDTLFAAQDYANAHTGVPVDFITDDQLNAMFARMHQQSLMMMNQLIVEMHTISLFNQQIEQGNPLPPAIWTPPVGQVPTVVDSIGSHVVAPSVLDPNAMSSLQTQQLEQTLIAGGVAQTSNDALALIDAMWARYATGMLPTWNIEALNTGHPEWVDTNPPTDTVNVLQPVVVDPLALDNAFLITQGLPQ